jgi:hypothetical protein
VLALGTRGKGKPTVENLGRSKFRIPHSPFQIVHHPKISMAVLSPLSKDYSTL